MKHGKRYVAAVEKIDETSAYNPKEAVTLANGVLASCVM